MGNPRMSYNFRSSDAGEAKKWICLVSDGFVWYRIALRQNENGFVFLLYAFRMQGRVRNASSTHYHEKKKHFEWAHFEIPFDIAASVGICAPFCMVSYFFGG